MKKTTNNKTLTPEQYIRQKARMLPLGQCYMNKNWFISGIAIAVVSRCHNKGTYTFAVFQIDTFCTGIIDCKIEFSKDKESYDKMMAYLQNTFKVEPVTYQEVHNLVYGANGFGEDAGFTAPTVYKSLGQYLLEEDTEDIPLINYQFGRFGKHFLWADSESELDEYMPHLIAHLGKENVLFGLIGSDTYFRGEDFYDSKTRAAMREIASKIRHQQPVELEPYSYEHPLYPGELDVKHSELSDILYDPQNRLSLSDEQLQQILALPHDELKADLEAIILHELHKTCDEIPEVAEGQKDSALLHAIMLLGELGDPENLNIVLETLCQKKAFFNYHIGVCLNEVYVPTLYKIANNQLDQLFEFLQIPGLYTYARYVIFPTLEQIAVQEPERRGEVIEWFRKVLQFYSSNLVQSCCCDGVLIGLLTTDLIKLKAVELLPELKVLYNTGKVNEQCCGNYDQVVELMNEAKAYTITYQYEIGKRYEDLRKNFEQLVIAQDKLIAEDKAAEAEMAPPTEAYVAEGTAATDDVEDAQVVEEVVTEAEEKPAAKATKAKASAEAKPKATRSKKAAAPKAETEEVEAEPAKVKKASKAKASTAKATSTAKSTKASKTIKAAKEEAPAKSKTRKTKESGE